MRALALSLAAFCLLAWAAAAGAQVPGAQVPKAVEPSGGPISITSERMEANSTGDVVTFTGNVVATQADGMLKARLVRVFYHDVPAKGSAEPQRDITRIEAENDVIIVRGQRTATGDRAVYSAADRTITLTGHAKVRQERDWVQGPKVVYYIDGDRSVVEGAPGQRVQSTIYPKGKPAEKLP